MAEAEEMQQQEEEEEAGSSAAAAVAAAAVLAPGVAATVVSKTDKGQVGASTLREPCHWCCVGTPGVASSSFQESHTSGTCAKRSPDREDDQARETLCSPLQGQESGRATGRKQGKRVARSPRVAGTLFGVTGEVTTWV